MKSVVSDESSPLQDKMSKYKGGTARKSPFIMVPIKKQTGYPVCFFIHMFHNLYFLKRPYVAFRILGHNYINVFSKQFDET